MEDIKKGVIPECVECKKRLDGDLLKPQGMKRKRSSNGTQKDRKDQDSSDDEDDYELPTPGIMKVSLFLIWRHYLYADLFFSPISHFLEKIFLMSSVAVLFIMTVNEQTWSLSLALR